MANLRIKGDVSGYVDLVAPDVAGSQTVNLDKLVETDNSGNITATAFIGDGSQLTGVSSYTDSDLVTYLSNNSIGIGDSSPDAKLHVQTASGSTTEPNVVAIFQADTDTTITTGGGTAIKFRGKSSGGNIANYDQAMISSYGQSTNNAHGLGFYYKPNASIPLTRGMLMDTNGSVCIGYGNPSANTKLQVEGNINASGYVRAARGTVQTVINTPNTAASGNPINVWSEINSNYRVSITPQYSDTHILGTFHIPMNPTGATNILMAIQPWWSTDGGTTKNIMAQGNTSVQGSRHNLSVSWFRSSNGFDVNDMQNHVVHFRHDHNTTSTITFGFYFRSEGGNTTYFCHSQGDNGTWGWVAPMYFELREVTV